jgi:hypothetical protein
VGQSALSSSSFGGTDEAAIHDNVAGEIAAITEKASPIAADLLLLEDSVASNAKKKGQIGNLPFAKIDTGSYTGDGSTGQAITGLGFQPKFVIIWIRPSGEASTQFHMKLDQSWGDYSVFAGVFGSGDHYVFDNKINSLDADGFTVDDDGLDSHPNTNGVTYDYVAWG